MSAKHDFNNLLAFMERLPAIHLPGGRKVYWARLFRQRQLVDQVLTRHRPPGGLAPRPRNSAMCSTTSPPRRGCRPCSCRSLRPRTSTAALNTCRGSSSLRRRHSRPTSASNGSRADSLSRSMIPASRTPNATTRPNRALQRTPAASVMVWTSVAAKSVEPGRSAGRTAGRFLGWRRGREDTITQIICVASSALGSRGRDMYTGLRVTRVRST